MHTHTHAHAHTFTHPHIHIQVAREHRLVVVEKGELAPLPLLLVGVPLLVMVVPVPEGSRKGGEEGRQQSFR